MQQQQQDYDDFDDDVNYQIIHERNASMEEIEREIFTLTEIFNDLAVLLVEQGEQLDAAESQVESAAEATTEAVQHLSRAAHWKSQARGIVLDAGTIVAGTGLGALGFLASPVVGVPTLVGGIISSVAIVTLRRQISSNASNT
jgi:hypothetical protein